MPANTGVLNIQIRVKDDGSVVVERFGKTVEDAGKKSEKSFGMAGVAIDGLITKMASLFAAYKVTKFVEDTALMAARYETLGVVMDVVGHNAGYTTNELNAQAAALNKSGITMQASRESVIKLIQAHIDLTNATKLSRIAQDAAVIANMNSSEAYQQLVYGIQTEQIRVLKTMGINVNFEESYRKLGAQIGKTSEQLTENERVQARLNAVMERGKDIAGTYEAAMSTAGKKLLSFQRYIDDFKTKMGEAFQPAMVILVDKATDAMKKFTEEIVRPESQSGLTDFANGIASIGSAMFTLAKASAEVVKYAGLRSISETMAEGMKLAKEGYINQEQFIKASFLERQRMVDEAKSGFGEQRFKIDKSYVDVLNPPKPKNQTPEPTVLSEAQKKEIKEREKLIADFNQQYREIGLSSFDVDRMKVDDMAKKYHDAKIPEVKIDKWVADQKAKINEEENKKRLETLNNFSTEYQKIVLSPYAVERMEIDATAKKYTDAGADKTQVAEWVAQKNAEINEKIIADDKQAAEERIRNSRYWLDGATRALDDYAYEASDAAYNVESAFRNGISNIEDSLVSLNTTGKASVNDLINSIMQDLSRLTVRQYITSPLMQGISQALASYFGNNSLGASTSSIGASTPSTGLSTTSLGTNANANGNAFYHGLVSRFANGGIFTNRIIDRPTLFRYGSGGAFGEMGEAGAEAIMPLRRTKSGRLGVETSGGSSPVINLIVNNKVSDAQVTHQSQTVNSDGSIDLTILLDQVDDYLASKAAYGRSSFAGMIESRNGLPGTAGLMR